MFFLYIYGSFEYLVGLKNFLSSNYCSIPLWFFYCTLLWLRILICARWCLVIQFFVKIQRMKDTESRNKASTKRIQKNEGHSQPGPYKPLPQVKSILNRCIANNNRQRWWEYWITYPNPSTKRNMEVRWNGKPGTDIIHATVLSIWDTLRKPPLAIWRWLQETTAPLWIFPSFSFGGQ